MAHTKGPWEYVPEEFNTERQDDQPGSICSAADWYIAAVEFVHSEEETLANAQVIATAPDLLAACETIHEWLGTDDVAQALPFEPPWYEQLRAVIAKAKGEAPNE